MLKLGLLCFIARLWSIHAKSVSDKETDSLACYVCYSELSWQDCESKQKTASCPHSGNDVCVTAKYIKRIQRNGTWVQTTTYTKHCDTTEGCSNDECKALGWICTTKCCNQYFCNSSVSMVSSTFYVMSAISASSAFKHFLWFVYSLIFRGFLACLRNQRHLGDLYCNFERFLWFLTIDHFWLNFEKTEKLSKRHNWNIHSALKSNVNTP